MVKTFACIPFITFGVLQTDHQTDKLKHVEELPWCHDVSLRPLGAFIVNIVFNLNVVYSSMQC